jgi:hypothetical protein
MITPTHLTDALAEALPLVDRRLADQDIPLNAALDAI